MIQEILAHILGWIIVAVFTLGFLYLIGYLIYLLWGSWNNWGKIKVYYDENDHSKGYYWISPPGNSYPLGYPREKILEEREQYENLKREQKVKNKDRSPSGKPRPLWLRILLMTPSEYLEYRRKKRQA